jgi:hypothetical protein
MVAGRRGMVLTAWCMMGGAPMLGPDVADLRGPPGGLVVPFPGARLADALAEPGAPVRSVMVANLVHARAKTMFPVGEPVLALAAPALGNCTAALALHSLALGNRTGALALHPLALGNCTSGVALTLGVARGLFALTQKRDTAVSLSGIAFALATAGIPASTGVPLGSCLSALAALLAAAFATLATVVMVVQGMD